MNFRFGAIAAFLLLALLMGACSSSDPSARKKSFWESFTDFFSPSDKPKGDGELYRELSDMEKEIHETEWKYSRENRPQRKSRYKSYLARLRFSRDSLVNVIESEGELSSSSRVSPVSSSSVVSKPDACGRVDSVFVSTTVTRFVHDTVFVRDTVLIRDTVFLDSSSPILKMQTN